MLRISPPDGQLREQHQVKVIRSIDGLCLHFTFHIVRDATLIRTPKIWREIHNGNSIDQPSTDTNTNNILFIWFVEHLFCSWWTNQMAKAAQFSAICRAIFASTFSLLFISFLFDFHHVSELKAKHCFVHWRSENILHTINIDSFTSPHLSKGSFSQNIEKL